MSQWIRVLYAERCGHCGERIEKGAAALELQGRPPATWRSYRCSRFACAGEAIPENLPEFVERPRVLLPSTMLKVGPDLLPLDYKTKAGGE